MNRRVICVNTGPAETNDHIAHLGLGSEKGY
jgi:hypothetical protein